MADPINATIKTVAAVTTQAYDYGSKVKHAKEDIENINRELVQVGQVLEKLKALAERAEKAGQSGQSLDAWPTLIELNADDGPLAKCNQSLLDLKSELAPVSSLREKLSQKAKWPQKKEKVEKSLQAIVKEKNVFLEMLNVDHITQRFDATVAVSKAQIEAKKNEIINWLSPTDPRTNQEAARKKHEEQTCKWFTEGPDYAAWLEQPNSFFWLHGIPGCGKTILCSEIIEETTKYCSARRNHHFAYFFFSFRETEKQKASNLPRSILAQLLMKAENVPTALQIIYDKYQHGEPSERGLLESIQALLIGSHTYIIIDALDECPNAEEERAELCNILKVLNSWGNERLHVLVTSRKEADLAEALLPIVTQKPIGIQGSVVDTDIRKFVRTQLKTNSRLSKWPIEIQAEIEQTLVKKSGGMFRWVVCQFHSLSKCLSQKDVRNALSSLPRTLDETYERILVNIPIDYQSKALTALQWIIYAVKELSLVQVSDAIIINPKADPPFSLADRPPEPLWILETLPGLVTIGGASQKVEIAHFSVIEYLESPRIMDTPVNMFHLDPSKANTSILKDCVDVLKSHSHPVNQTILKDNNWESQSFDVSPLCHYACEHGHDHAELLRPPIEEEIKSLILDFVVNVDSILQGCLSELPKTIWTDLSRAEKCPSDPLEKGLHIASRYGLSNIVTVALDAGADINLTIKDGPTALQRAIDGNWPETVRALVDAGADINLEGVYNGLITPLQLAVYLRQKLIVKILLDAGANVDLKAGLSGSELQEASGSGDADIVKLLLDAGANVNLKGGHYGSALQAASWGGNADTVQLLINRGADVNQNGGEYGSALQAASWRDDTNTMKLLLNAGADVNQKGGDYGSALQAASWGGDADTVKLLLDAGADVNVNGGMHGSALQAASWGGDADTVKLLLDAGADVNLNGGMHGSALQAASWGGDVDTVKLLLDAGADVNQKGGDHGSALQAASWGSDPDTVKLLLDAGADVNLNGGIHGSALQAALWRDNADIVKLLLDAGADVNQKGGEYGSGLRGARAGRRDDIVNLLLSAGAVDDGDMAAE